MFFPHIFTLLVNYFPSRTCGKIISLPWDPSWLQIAKYLAYILPLVIFIPKIHEKCKKKKHTQKSFYSSHLTNVLIFVYVLVTFIGNSVFYTLLLFFFTFSKCKVCHNYKTHSCCIVPNCRCATCLRKCLGMALLCLKSV